MTSPIDVPKQSVAPKEVKRDPAMGVTNWADKADTVKEVLTRARMHCNFFRAQGAWAKMILDIKKADEMTRLATSQTKQDENKTRTAVDTIPDHFHRALRTITANENDIMFHRDDPPVRFVPMEHSTEGQQLEAVGICEQRNALLEFSMVADGRVDKMKDGQWTLNKYGNMVDSMTWFSGTKTVRERRPTSRDKDGVPTAYAWTDVEREVHHPEWNTYHLENCFFNANVGDMQAQQLFGVDLRVTLDKLVRGQTDKKYLNVGNITSKHQADQYDDENARGDRQGNAGDGDDTNEATGEIAVRDIWMRAPIDEDGKWDEKNAPARIIHAMFAGPFDQDPICILLTEMPYHDGEIPYRFAHSHRDDKGAIHMGYRHLLGPGYDELKTAFDQWFDNKNLQNAAPWIEEYGALINKDRTFGPRRFLQLNRGQWDKLKRVDVPSNTGDMQAFIGFIIGEFDQAAAANRAFRGEALGARTSASEARNALEQSLKPALDKLRFNASRHKWMAEKDAALWANFAPASMVITISSNDVISEIRPAQLHGEFRCKVMAIDKFEQNSVIRLEQDKFLQAVLPVLAPALGPKKLVLAIGDIFKPREILSPEVHKLVFSPAGELDAHNVATGENVGFREGNFVPPQEDENHEVHISVHKTQEQMLAFIPGEEVHPDTATLTKAHRTMHEQMVQQIDQGLARGAAQAEAAQNTPAPGEGVAQTEGQVAQELLGAEGGEVAA